MRLLLSPPLWLTAAILGLGGAAGHAASVSDVDAVPHLDAHGKAGYRQFLATPSPRAFAVAPGGAWGLSTEAGTTELAEQEALANCQANTAQRCQIYARDLEVVFDTTAWTRSWGPYRSADEAGRSPIGTKLGTRFPDIAFADAKGKAIKLSDLRGKVVVLHFWGSWCPPCKREMPDLARSIGRLGQAGDIRFVLLQVREDFISARRWAASLGKRLPLYDSGMKGSRDSVLKLADGGHIGDRDIAKAFPTTYVIDKHGIVVFAHVGPVARWESYLPFLRDAAARSGK